MDKDLLVAEDATNEKDLLLDMSDNTEALVKNNIVDSQLLLLREEVNESDISKLDKYNDSLLYQAYYVAKKCKTASKRIIARQLGISLRLMNYYLETYPKLGLVIQMAVMDARDEMKETIVDALLSAAKGQEVTEQSTAVETVYDTEGAVLGSKEKITTVTKHIAPNVSAGLELMKRLDPAWVPQVNVDVSGQVDHNLNVVKDVNVAVDYKQLSPAALKELLNSQKLLNQRDTKSYKNEDNESVVVKGLKNKVEKEPNKKRASTTRKTKSIVDEAKKQVKRVRKQAKTEANNDLIKE